MGNLSAKESALEVLRAMERVSEVFMRCTGQPNISFDIGEWLIGRKWRESPIQSLDALAISQLSSDNCRLEHIIQLSKGLTASASELFDLLQRRMKPLSLKLSKGIDSLPNELLASIFKFATLHEQEGFQHMIWLSHVSRRFRAISLGTPHLWTDIRLGENMPKECIETYFSRSGKGSDLHMLFNLSSDTEHRDLIIMQYLAETWLPSISRWQWLSLVYDCEVGEPVLPIGSELDRLMCQHMLVLPRLHGLALTQCHWPIRCNKEPPWFDGLNVLYTLNARQMPNLRILRCIQYIPPASFPFTSLTSFALSLMVLSDDVYCSKQIKGLLEFLSLQPNITTIEIELDFFEGVDEWGCDDLDGFTVTICPNVTDFKLKIINLILIADVFGIGPTLRLLHMPRLEDFFLFLDIQSGWDPAKMESGQQVFLVNTSDLVPNPSKHSNIAFLNISMPAPRMDGITYPSKIECNSLEISIDEIFQVTSLYVTSFAPVTFCRSFLLPKGVKNVCMEELHLLTCENLTNDGLRQMVQSLKDVGAWETLERVFIRECNLLDYDFAMEVIGQEKLRFEGKIVSLV